nr:hypothetical protein [Tanacetum cinerariifolium]
MFLIALRFPTPPLACAFFSPGATVTGPHETFQCQPTNEEYYHEQNSCYKSNSFGFDHCQPPQYTVNHPIFNVHNNTLTSQPTIMEQMMTLTSMCEMVCQIFQKKQEEKRIEEEQAANARYWKIPACCDDDDDYDSAITPVLSTEEPVNSLSMGDEHLDIVLATESDEVIKSGVEDLVLIPSESEGENGCDVPSCFTTFSNILFDADYDFESVDDQSLHNEDVSEKSFANPLFEEEIISIRIDQHQFNVESDLVESMLNRDSSVISSSSKIDSLLDEFVEIDLSFNPDDPMPPSIEDDDNDSKGDNLFLETLLHDDPIPLPDTLDFSNVVKVFLPFFTYPVTSSILHPFGNEDTIFDPGITINHIYSFKPSVSHQCGAFKKFNTHRSHLNEWPMIINGKNITILDVLLLLYLAGSQPMLKSSYKAEASVIISIPPFVRGVADVVVEIKGT